MLRSYNPTSLTQGSRMDKENRTSQFPKTPGMAKTPGVKPTLATKTPGTKQVKTPGVHQSDKMMNLVTPSNKVSKVFDQTPGTNVGKTTSQRPTLRDITNKTPAPTRHRQTSGGTARKAHLDAMKTPAPGFHRTGTTKKIPVLQEQTSLDEEAEPELANAPGSIEEEEVPDVEYMPPRAQELPYDPGFEWVDFNLFRRAIPDYNSYRFPANAEETEEALPEFEFEPIDTPTFKAEMVDREAHSIRSAVKQERVDLKIKGNPQPSPLKRISKVTADRLAARQKAASSSTSSASSAPSASRSVLGTNPSKSNVLSKTSTKSLPTSTTSARKPLTRAKQRPLSPEIMFERPTVTKEEFSLEGLLADARRGM